MLEKYRFIAVEGPIGAGKTSLARRIAAYLHADTLLEGASENPFLPRFYQDPKRHALATQLFFLFQRSAQVQDLQQSDLFRHNTVADFLLDKDLLFARLNLDDDEFRLYQKIYDELQPKAPVPDLVIYLQARPDILQARVLGRGIDYERNISTDYLRRLAESYTHYFYNYTAAPLFTVNCEHLNFVQSDADFVLLMQQIEGMRGNREFFNRAV